MRRQVRAAVVEEMGRPPAAAELPEPKRGPGEALVRIHAAALNPVELHIWNGHFFDGPPRPPYVIGLEGVGVVEEGDRLAPGTRVRVEFVHPGYGRDGALAEYAVAPEEPDASDRASQASVTPIGDELDDTDRRGAGRAGLHRADVPRARAVRRGVSRRRPRARDRRDGRRRDDRGAAREADGRGAGSRGRPQPRAARPGARARRGCDGRAERGAHGGGAERRSSARRRAGGSTWRWTRSGERRRGR